MISALLFATPGSAEQGISAYNVKVTEKYVMATGVCSCNLMEDREHHTKIFYNINPETGNHGVIYFEEGSIAWTSPEGLWVASDTDMDFCLFHGKSHDNRRMYLIPYNGEVDGYIVKNGYLTNKKVQNKTEVSAQTIYGQYVEMVMDGRNYKLNKEKLEQLKNGIS